MRPLSLTERSRLDAGVQGTYPSAAARMMSLYLALLRRQLPGDWRFEGMAQVTRIAAENEKALVDLIVPAMSRAYDLCEICCANVGRGIGGAEPLSADARKSFAHDLAVLLRGRGSETKTGAGQELTALQAARLAILDPMRSLRRSSWRDLPCAS